MKIHDNYIICPRRGGKIEAIGFGGFFLCPDYNLMCSGTVLCNDLFDCVEQKSEAKNESYYYDYDKQHNYHYIQIIYLNQYHNY